MPDRLITARADEMSAADFLAMVTGRPRKTKAEREAEYRADIERYVKMIEAGMEWAVPYPDLHECRRVIALREEVHGDPFLKRVA